jgi:hypothetical protein
MALTVDSAIVDSDPTAVNLVGGLLGASSSSPNAARLGRRIAALFATWQRGRLPDMANFATGMLLRNGIDTAGPIARTCVAAARAVAAWGGLPYHSVTHHAEVTTNAMLLVEISHRRGQTIDRRETALLLAVCLSHDLYYSPSAARVRFAAENTSAEALDAIAAAAGCDVADRQAMRALVIATEPGLRLRPSGPPGRTAVEPALTALAAILSDADLLSSVGLTVGWYRVQETRLEHEADRPAETGDAERFFNDIVGPDFLSDAGRVFSANLAAIRRAVCRPS